MKYLQELVPPKLLSSFFKLEVRESLYIVTKIIKKLNSWRNLSSCKIIFAWFFLHNCWFWVLHDKRTYRILVYCLHYKVISIELNEFGWEKKEKKAAHFFFYFFPTMLCCIWVIYHINGSWDLDNTRLRFSYSKKPFCKIFLLNFKCTWP